MDDIKFGFSTQALFAKSDVETLKPKTNQTNSTKSSKLPMRSTTPSHNKQRPNIIKNTNEQQLGTHPTTTNHISNFKKEHDATNNTKHSNPLKKANNFDHFLSLNQKKNVEPNETQRKPRIRGVSPSVKPKASDIVIELSNETPQNLRTDKRSSSSTRGRSTTRASIIGGCQNQDPTPKACRPSRSPSPNMSNKNGLNYLDRTQKNMKTQKETFSLAAGSNESRSYFKGSKMVEKVVNARKSSINHIDRETKLKPIKHKV